MAFLAVRRVKYDGERYAYESPPIQNGLNILEGKNGTGKSTFSNLICFGLGGRVESFLKEKPKHHAEITGDKKNFVELLITIGGQSYTLKRFIGTNDIAVNGDDVSDLFPVGRRGDGKEIFSDWILTKLAIEPVSLQVGTHSGYLNITDFMRLIYHDQSPDPSGIYRAAEVSSFVTDSRDFREAIFEILIGKSFQAYYSALMAFRDAERKKTAADKALELFKGMVSHLSGQQEDMNLIFLDKRLTELRDQQSRLLAYRHELAKAPPARSPGGNLPQWQQDLLARQIKIAGVARTEAGLLEELSRLHQLKADLISEATQLRKMMFAHEELKLFSANTCPYCLKEVKREPHKCACGNPVQEGDYEKFFYDSDEYLSILKSRQKNAETVDIAANSARAELDALRLSKGELEREAGQLIELIETAVAESDTSIDLRQFEEAETKLAGVRDEIAKLEQQRELEAKRELLEQDVTNAKTVYDATKTNADKLALDAHSEMQAKKIEFSKIYNRLMRETLPGCRSASIGDDYMPEVNGGEYTQASADVPKRLLYYATLLEMSLIDESVKFPRFLLIDTPETSGIDPANLKAAISRIVEIIEAAKKIGRECQVILTTGIGKYPAAPNANMLGTMDDDTKLLKSKPHAELASELF